MSWERVPEIRRRMGEKINEVDQTFDDQQTASFGAMMAVAAIVLAAGSEINEVYKVGALAGGIAVCARAAYAYCVGIPKRRKELLENLSVTENDAYLQYIDHEDFMT